MKRGPGDTRAQIPNRSPTLRALTISTWGIGRPSSRIQRVLLHAALSKPNSAEQSAAAFADVSLDAPPSPSTCRASALWSSHGAAASNLRARPARPAVPLRTYASTRYRRRRRISPARVIIGISAGTTRIQSRASAIHRRGFSVGASTEKCGDQTCASEASNTRIEFSFLARIWSASMAVCLNWQLVCRSPRDVSSARRC